jgi:hypothetical protein
MQDSPHDDPSKGHDAPMEEKVQKILERVVRTESRVVQLGDHVGANLRQQQRIEIHNVGSNLWQVEIDAMDVSLSRIVSELRRRQIRAHAVGVWLEGQLVATVYPEAIHNIPVPKGQQ